MYFEPETSSWGASDKNGSRAPLGEPLETKRKGEPRTEGHKGGIGSERDAHSGCPGEQLEGWEGKWEEVAPEKPKEDCLKKENGSQKQTQQEG